MKGIREFLKSLFTCPHVYVNWVEVPGIMFCRFCGKLKERREHMKDELSSFDETIHEILVDNKELVDLNEEMDGLKTHKCTECGAYVSGEEGVDYIRMVGIARENMGAITYYCIKHVGERLLPTQKKGNL